MHSLLSFSPQAFPVNSLIHIYFTEHESEKWKVKVNLRDEINRKSPIFYYIFFLFFLCIS